MVENKKKQINKKVISDKSVVYESWEDFWTDMCEDQLDINVPVRFYWSGDKDLNVELMSINVARLDQRNILECIINNVPHEKFLEYTSFYKNILTEQYDNLFIKSIEDY